jgi:hypothetical protein
MDQKLGTAFETFRTQVERSVSEVRQHAEDVHGKFGDALDKLREVVDQAQEFAPESTVR